MRRTSISIALLALLAACGEAPTSPTTPTPATPRLSVGSAENGTVVLRTGSEQSLVGVFQLCGSTEPVDLEATVVTRVQGVLLASGGTRFTAHLVARVFGTGMNSGLRYVGHETLTEVVVFPGADGSAAATHTWNVRVRIVRQGSAADLAGVTHVKQTINANGVVTTAFIIVEGECVVV